MNQQAQTEIPTPPGRPTPRWLKRRKPILWLIFGLLAVWLIRDERASWDEEVQLSDGRVIWIEQKRRYKSAYDGHSFGKHMVKESWIWFQIPELGNERIEWNERLFPMRFDIVDGKPFIVAYPPTGEEFYLYGKPKPMYLAFSFESGKWKRINFEAIPLSQYKTNLVIKSYISWNARPLTLRNKASKELNGNPDIYKCLTEIVLAPKCNYWDGNV